MEGQDLGHRVLALGGIRLAPPCRLAVQPGALRSRQGAVRDLLDEDVAEVVAVALRGPDEVAVDQVLAQRLHARRVTPFEGRHARGAERAAEYAAQLEQSSLL